MVGSDKIANNSYTAHTPQALMGITAYTLDDTDLTTRLSLMAGLDPRQCGCIWVSSGLVSSPRDSRAACYPVLPPCLLYTSDAADDVIDV